MKLLSRREFLRRAAVGTAGLAAAGTGVTSAWAAVFPQRERAVAAAAQDTQVVTFTMFGHPGMIEEMVPLFNETHPGIEVRFERSEGQGYSEKILTAVAAGTVWDSFRGVSPGENQRFGTKGVVEEITPYLDADTDYPADQYLPGALSVSEYQGKRYGLPTWCLTMWLYYNKRLLDEAAIAYPTPETTWEEYVEMAQQLTLKNGDGVVTQYGANGWGNWTMPVAQDVWSNGGNFYYNEDLTAFDVDDPETAQALQDEAALMNVLGVHPSPLNPPASPVSLLSGSVATELNGDWMPWDNRDNWTEDFDATLTPLRNGQRVNIYYPDSLVINSQSAVKDAAYKWVSWFAADPASWAIQGKVVFPVTRQMYEDPELRATWLVAPRPQGMIDLVEQHVADARFWQMEPHAAEFENTIYYSEIDKLWRDVATAEEVGRIMTERGNELIQQPI